MKQLNLSLKEMALLNGITAYALLLGNLGVLNHWYNKNFSRKEVLSIRSLLRASIDEFILTDRDIHTDTEAFCLGDSEIDIISTILYDLLADRGFLIREGSIPYLYFENKEICEELLEKCKSN